MGSCASVVRKKQMQKNLLDKSNLDYVSYTAKNNSNYKIKNNIEINKMSDYHTNPTFKVTPRYT